MDDHLLVECARLHSRTDLGEPVRLPPGCGATRYFEAQLEALAAIDLLADREATAWRRRFRETPERDPEVHVDAALRERAQRYLESIWPDDPDNAEYFPSAVDLLEELGVISEKDSERWFDRLNEGADADLEAAEDFPWPECRELRQVLLGPPDERAGFRLTDVELYDDCVLARWNVFMPDGLAETRFALAGPEPVISDDRATDYESVCTVPDASSGGMVMAADARPLPRWRGETTFIPAVPEAATRLVLRWEGQHFELELEP